MNYKKEYESKLKTMSNESKINELRELITCIHYRALQSSSVMDSCVLNDNRDYALIVLDSIAGTW